MKCSLILSISPSVCFAFVPSLCLNHVTWLSLCACRLCLLCRYPLAPSHFDKLGHENKPPQCQENAKYRASFLWQCLFNQLPLISALHPLFLSFQNVMEEKSVHRQRLLLSTLLLLRPRSLVHSSAVVFLTLSLNLCHSSCHLAYSPPRCIFFCLISPFFPCFVSFAPRLSPSCLPVFLLLCVSSFFALQFLHSLSLFFLYFFLFQLSLPSTSAIALLPSLRVLQCALMHQAAKLHKHEPAL